ncbi:phosphatidate cytidylyltransferase [Sorangium cellulosum]|uniref:Phosphatidate cytidylyltransferase n=1 Tax=Sorangium cellulosum TaxID=56 RepID=A0A2L0F360_SORCE|nr:phosphatidate cytidylyltransferase [Sorangium cellulosum]AUX46014.1 phosphatidate cytidylyltransferase [Sorangium cellulosum]
MAASNLTMRVLSALVAAPLILTLLYLGPSWGWAALVAAAAAVGALEFFAMTHADDRAGRIAGVALTLAVIGVLWRFGHSPRALLALIFLLPLAAMLVTLARLGEMRTAALRVLAVAFGPLYVGGGLGALALLRRDAGADGPSFVVLALLLSWFSDTGAYFAGRFLGKHKLYEAVSPKKTVEGALGGLLFAVLGMLLAHVWFLRSLPLVDGFALAIVAGGLGQAGDLGESLFKRSFGIKDSGGIVPGHGGILDRVDALIVTGTITYLYVLWVRS